MKAEAFIKVLFGNKSYYIEETQEILRYYNNDFDVIVNKNLLKNLIVIDKREHQHIIYPNMRVAHDALVF